MCPAWRSTASACSATPRSWPGPTPLPARRRRPPTRGRWPTRWRSRRTSRPRCGRGSRDSWRSVATCSSGPAASAPARRSRGAGGPAIPSSSSAWWSPVDEPVGEREGRAMTTQDGPSARRDLASRMADAALAFSETLDDAQREAALWPFPADDERRLWFYTPTDHGGVTLSQLSPPQQRLALQLVASGLSVAGYVTVATIMGLENILDQEE